MSRFERWSVWITTALTAATGIGYFWTKYLVEPSGPFAVVNHPLQPFFLKAHILVSPLLLLALGMISLRHVWRHFRSGVRWSRRSGLTTALSVLPMVATGYLIQTFTATGWVRAMALSHIGFGTLYLVGISLHQVFVRRGPTGAGTPREGWGSEKGRPARRRGRAAAGAGGGRVPAAPEPAAPESVGRGSGGPRSSEPGGAPRRKRNGANVASGTQRESGGSWP